MTQTGSDQLAIWAVTPGGLSLAIRLREAMPGVLHVSERLLPCPVPCVSFSRLGDSVKERFSRFKGHVFIMSAGIVVRVIAPCLNAKTIDPAVVVLDEKGRHAISLLSGHIGGANRLAAAAAEAVRATPVITTATDLHGQPAIDVLAVENDLFIENPAAVKTVSMAFLNQVPVYLHDPCQRLNKASGHFKPVPADAGTEGSDRSGHDGGPHRISGPMVAVDDRILNFPEGTLILRPRTLIAGMGCNRGTGAEEIRNFLTGKMAESGLSLHSLKCLATIDIKSDEAGLLETAAHLGIPIRFFPREALSAVESPNPSKIVQHHIGVSSVCEAAAILASEKGELIVPKQISPNVTLAVARINCSSSDLGPAAPITFPNGPQMS